jgi:hypothetical protein
LCAQSQFRFDHRDHQLKLALEQSRKEDRKLREEDRKLRLRLAAAGFVDRESCARADGNCMFDALADQLHASDYQNWHLPQVRASASSDVRETIATAVLKGRLWPLQRFLTETELKDLPRQGGWGCHTVLQAAAILFKRNIVIYSSRDELNAAPCTIQPSLAADRLAADQHLRGPLRLCHWFEHHLGSLESAPKK